MGLRISGIDFAPLHFLIVEDNDFVRFMVKKYLRSYGVEHLREAVSGKQALRMVDEQAPDIVICDIHMQNGDGFDFLQQMRESQPPSSNIPIIFLTSSADEAFVRRALELKVDAYILKPVTARALREKIEVIMAGKWTAGGGAEKGEGQE